MIAENLVHFARMLRGAGLAVGPDRVIAALAAIEVVGFDRRDDVHAALGAVMLDRHEQQTLFDAAFEAFWRDPALFGQVIRMATKPGRCAVHASTCARRCCACRVSRRRWLRPGRVRARSCPPSSSCSGRGSRTRCRPARRLLGSNAALLLVTDGLDGDVQGDLGRAAAQLRRHAHRIVRLNPLLRFNGFEPRAAGVRALLPHVDRFLPMHNLTSLADLGRALRVPAERPATLLHPHHDGRIRHGAA